MNQISVTLLRMIHIDRQWQEYNKATHVSISSSGISVREDASFTLVCDFPFLSIISFESVQDKKLLKLQVRTMVQHASSDSPNQVTYGLRFHNSSSMLNVLDILSDHNILGQSLTSEMLRDKCYETIFPNLSDAAVKEYIVRLLFNEQFCKFAHDLSELMDDLSKNLSRDDPERMQESSSK